MVGGRRLEIEVKAPDKYRLKKHNMSKGQAVYGQMIRDLGGIYFVECDVEKCVESVKRLIAIEREKLDILSSIPGTYTK